jgi:hypothetical protein
VDLSRGLVIRTCHFMPSALGGGQYKTTSPHWAGLSRQKRCSQQS